MTNDDMGEGGPKIAIFAVTSFLNGPLLKIGAISDVVNVTRVKPTSTQPNYSVFVYEE